MNTCGNCNKNFYPVTCFEGKRLWRRGRKYCFDCVPYKPASQGTSFTHNRNTLDNKRQCRTCKQYKSLGEFSPTNKIGNLNSYCKPCASKKTQTPRQRLKDECIIYKGGQCIVCGYNKCPAALEFHHRDPRTKEFSMRDLHSVIFTESVKRELDKCDLLCSNCHKEKHYFKESS